VAEAKRALGYPYTLSAEVIPGKKLGRTLGFPTANLKVIWQFIPMEVGI